MKQKFGTYKGPRSKDQAPRSAETVTLTLKRDCAEYTLKALEYYALIRWPATPQKEFVKEFQEELKKHALKRSQPAVDSSHSAKTPAAHDD